MKSETERLDRRWRWTKWSAYLVAIVIVGMAFASWLNPAVLGGERLTIADTLLFLVADAAALSGCWLIYQLLRARAAHYERRS